MKTNCLKRSWPNPNNVRRSQSWERQRPLASNFNRDGIMSSVLVENGFGIAISCLTSQPTPPRLYTTWQNSPEIYYILFSNPKLHLSSLLFTNRSIHKALISVRLWNFKDGGSYNFGTFWRTVIHRRIQKRTLWVSWFFAKNLAF